MKTAQDLLKANTLWRVLTAGFLIAICFLVFAFVSPVHAQEEAPSTEIGKSSNSFNLNSDVPTNFHSIVQVVFLETLSASICQLAGFDPLSENSKCLGVDPTTGKIGFVENGGGAIASVGRLIDYTFVPPASSVQYLSYMKSNFGVVKGAYAQEPNICRNDSKGVGFCGLIPLLPLWEAMRNIVYLILILVFVVIGLGIMLRVHIDPRTVMTLQNQIPKIIVGIIAITFSFAIAGLLIDFMWVAIYLFAGVIMSAAKNPTSLSFISTLDTPFTAMGTAFGDINDPVFGGGILGIAGTVSGAFANLVQNAFEAGGDWGVVGDLLGGIINLLAFLVVIIAIIVVLLRLWISLILAYINIILDVIFAPFWILAGLLPGSSIGLGAWLRDMTANLAVFPVTIGFFILGKFLIVQFDNSSSGLTNTFNPPLVGGMDPTTISAMIGFGFILMLPNLLSTMKAAIKAPKLSYGSLMGPVNSGLSATTGTPKRLVDVAGRAYYSQQGQPTKIQQLGKFFGNPYYFGGGNSGPPKPGGGHKS